MLLQCYQFAIRNVSSLAYNAAIATRAVARRPTKEPDRAFAALVPTVTVEGVEVPEVPVVEPVMVAVAIVEAPDSTEPVLLPPETPVTVEDEPLAVAEAPIPFPAPDGERPEPEETRTPELADAVLEAVATTPELATELDPEAVEVAEEEDADEDEVETLLQDKS